MNNSHSSGGVGFGGMLTIVFIILKLCGVIDWRWLWVLSPLWISLVISLVIIVWMVCWEKRNDTWRW